jgi:hypothetical protein
MAAGVPVGPIRSAPTALPEPDALRRALGCAGRALDASEEVALTAWLAAFRHHWPTAFEATLGAEAHVQRAALRSRVEDRNRFSRLRRIAIENLARVV